jgi:hypothetical protein
MTTSMQRTVKAVAMQADETALALTFMLRRLAEANDCEALPPDFLEHQEDLKSARGTIDRVSAALRAALPAAPLFQPKAP